MADMPLMSLSHSAVRVVDLPRMLAFFTDVLGFVVTDRRPLESREMVFLSRSPGEHHQIVLVSGGDKPKQEINHLAFRVETLADLRKILAVVAEQPDTALETVSHGTTWSIYFRDPENNRYEVLTDTPWHVAQPLRFEVDYSLSDEELIAATEERIRDLPDFAPKEEWRAAHTKRL